MNIKVKSVKSSNTKLATVKLAKNKKSYTITTKKKGTLKITVKYANNKVETLSLSIAHQHKWKTVVDKKAYDESVYETQDVYETRDVYTDKPVYEEHWFNNGVDVTAGTNDFNAAHGTNYAGGDRCIIDDLNAYLAECGATSGRDYSEWIQVGTEKVKTGTKKVKVGTKKVKVGTKHHAAVTHQECTTCGARKK